MHQEKERNNFNLLKAEIRPMRQSTIGNDKRNSTRMIALIKQCRCLETVKKDSAIMWMLRNNVDE